MRLANLDLAVVAQEKVTEYLLSHEHPSGRSKARFFEGFGFERTNWTRLVEALISHARSNEIARAEMSQFGTRYVIEGLITTPDGRSPGIRAVWFISHGSSVPYFVTAYPLQQERLP